MTASIIENSDGTSLVVVTWQDDNYHVVNIMETDSREDHGKIDNELFNGCAVFNYSLLGEPDADAEETSEADGHEIQFSDAE